MSGAGFDKLTAEPLALIAAMAEEVAPLRRRLRARARGRSPPGMRVERGELAGVPVLLAVTGAGARAASFGAAWLLEHERIRGMWCIGSAGALSASLRPGAVVCCREARREGEPTLFSPHPADGAVVVSVNRLVGTVAEKERLAAVHAAQGLAVVDLESWSFCAAADAVGVPWSILRVVSDAQDEPLPAWLLALQRADGEIRRADVMKRAALDFRMWNSLLALRARMSHCADVLARAVEARVRTF